MNSKPTASKTRNLETLDPGNPAFSEHLLESWRQGLPEVDASGVPVFALANAVMLRLKSWQAEILRLHDITLSDFQLLSTLYFSGPEFTASELRQVLWLTPGGMTRAIKRAQRLGWVSVGATAEDRRKIPVRLTREGNRKARDICTRVAEFYLEASAKVSEEEQRKIVEGMTLFLRKLDVG